MQKLRSSIVLLVAAALTVAGAGSASAAPAANRSFASLTHLASAMTADQNGTLYVATVDDMIARISVTGATMERFAALPHGAGVVALASDRAGNIYSANHNAQSISRITPAGTVTTFALDVGASPLAITTDSAGTVYVAEDNTMTVSRLTSSGVLTNGFAHLERGAGPAGIAVDSTGNVFTANSGLDTISKITPAGVTTLRFATVKPAFGSAVPVALAVDRSDNLFSANIGSQTVTKVTPTGSVELVATGIYSPAEIVADAGGDLIVTSIADHDSLTLVRKDGSTEMLLAGDGLGRSTLTGQGVYYGFSETMLTVTRADLSPTMVDDGPLPTGFTGAPYTYFFDATGLDPLRYNSVGALPPGLTLTSGGVLSGTPTSTGTFSFAVVATNELGSSAPHAVTVTIEPGLRPRPFPPR